MLSRTKASPWTSASVILHLKATFIIITGVLALRRTRDFGAIQKHLLSAVTQISVLATLVVFRETSQRKVRTRPTHPRTGKISLESLRMVICSLDLTRKMAQYGDVIVMFVMVPLWTVTTSTSAVTSSLTTLDAGVQDLIHSTNPVAPTVAVEVSVLQSAARLRWLTISTWFL